MDPDARYSPCVEGTLYGNKLKYQLLGNSGRELSSTQLDYRDLLLGPAWTHALPVREVWEAVVMHIP